MNKRKPSILNFIPKLVFLIVMALIVAGLAKFYSYFKTGASTSDLITVTQQDRLLHNPSYTWHLNNGQGVDLDEFTQQKIQDAYTASWYILNKSNQEQKDLGLADRFSKQMIEKITKSFKSKASQEEERTDLEHHIHLYLYSYDRQLVSFTDKRVKVNRKIYDLNTGHKYSTIDTLTFDVVMGLEDGYWKIFEFVQLGEFQIQ